MQGVTPEPASQLRASERWALRAVCPYCLTALALTAGTFVAATMAWRAAATPPTTMGHRA